MKASGTSLSAQIVPPTVINPAPREGLADERASLLAALENPIGEKPLKQLIKAPCLGVVPRLDSADATAVSVYLDVSPLV